MEPSCVYQHREPLENKNVPIAAKERFGLALRIGHPIPWASKRALFLHHHLSYVGELGLVFGSPGSSDNRICLGDGETLP